MFCLTLERKGGRIAKSLILSDETTTHEKELISRSRDDDQMRLDRSGEVSVLLLSLIAGGRISREHGVSHSWWKDSRGSSYGRQNNKTDEHEIC